MNAYRKMIRLRNISMKYAEMAGRIWLPDYMLILYQDKAVKYNEAARDEYNTIAK